MENARDLERNIQPDGIQQHEWADRHAECHHVLIDLLDGHIAVLEAPHGFIQIGREQAIDEETCAFLHDHRRLAETFGKTDDIIDGLGIGGQAGDDLHQRHRIGRIEKMKSEHLTGPRG